MPKITPEMAAAEVAQRELARRHLIDYSCYVAPWYEPARHHRLVAEKLEQVLRYIETGGAEGIGRLMIFEPPRHGKSAQISRLFPSWLLGRLPDSRVILTAYGADLASEDSRAVRNYVTSERYAAVFGEQSALDAPVELDEESSAKANWNLAAPHRGGVVAAGIGGGIVGKGAHLLVIDDPFKSREDADSEAYRKRVMSWYKSAAYTRLERGGAVVITHTRWHPDDLAGELLEAMVNDPLLADQWEILYLPALALEADDYISDEGRFREKMLRGQFIPAADPLGRKAGEPLWPEKYDRTELAKIAAVVQDEFDAQYQQLPRNRVGNFFDESMFQLVNERPNGLRWYVYVDLALGEKSTSDWNTAMATAMNTATGELVYRDLLRVQDLDDFLGLLEERMLTPEELGTLWGFESVAFSTLVFRQFARNPKLARVQMVEMHPDGDKVTRARAVRFRGMQKLVKVVRGAWWNEAWRELEVFPNGKHDDIVDTMSGGAQMVAQFAEGFEATATETAQVMTAAEMGLE